MPPIPENRTMTRRTTIALTAAALALASCGGDNSGPDWDGYAAYLTAEVRPDDEPIDREGVQEIYDEGFSCDDTTNEFYIAQTADGGRDLKSAAAAIYYLCGEDQAVDTFRSVFGVAGAADVRDWTPTFERHASG